MKVVLLCGGQGTRLAEETGVRPKPMVTIGTHPILWHIMNVYGAQGFNEFVLALGYKGDMIKEYFLKYYALNSDFTVDLASGGVTHETRTCRRNWKVSLADTGERTQTGGRLKRLEKQLRPEGTFMVTYGDGLSNVNATELLKFHRAHGKLATVTAVRPTARFGGLRLDGDRVEHFKEKPQSGEGWINGGFFVFEPGIFDHLEGDQSVLETAPLENLVKKGELMAYRHEGFWQCMDTVRERQLLEDLWVKGGAPWKTWKD
ncbi:MAG: glucose-1-phosphate cytidylyltransferase [Deltaproteobacteria bacterium]|nr:glucose-1-phosphate cytidylyltransferase [Deltaproteobacteria bacterium]